MSRLVWLSVAGLGFATWIAGAAPALLQESAEAPEPLQPPMLAGCSGPGSWNSAWAPETRGSTLEAAHSYQCGNRVIHVYAAMYLRQSRDAEALSDAQRVVPNVWEKRSRWSKAQVAGAFPVNQHELSVGGDSLRVWSWYAIGDDRYQSRWSAKLAEVLNALTFTPRPAAILVVAGEGGTEGEEDPTLAHAAREVWSWYGSLNFAGGSAG